MRSINKPTVGQFLTVLAMESVHVAGLGILYFVALPGMDTIKALVVASSVAFFPAAMKLVSIRQDDFPQLWKRILVNVLNVLAVTIQVLAMIIWPVANMGLDSETDPKYIENSWALPVGLFLTSFGWWESFVSQDSVFIGARFLWNLKTEMFEKSFRYFVYFFVSLWKIVLFFCLLLAYATFNLNGGVGDLFNKYRSSFHSSKYAFAYSSMGFTTQVEELHLATKVTDCAVI